MDFFSMGMFCVDEIHTETKSYKDVIGGAGTYAALGAGIVVPANERHKVGFICDEGIDFNPEMKKEIKSWSLNTIFRYNPHRETTKAWNKFTNNEERLFKYLSPKLQIKETDLQIPARNAKVIHLICSPQRAQEFLQKLKFENPHQKYVWEPVPTACYPDNFPLLKQVVTEYKIDILSPNALEAAAFVGLPEPLTKKSVGDIVDKYYDFTSVVVIRCGGMGSYVKTPLFKKWYPAYFTEKEQNTRVVDPCGAGNAFTGGLGEALAQNLNWDEMIAYASVSASFMIEQVGTPKYNEKTDQWNGDFAKTRINYYLQRLN